MSLFRKKTFPKIFPSAKNTAKFKFCVKKIAQACQSGTT